MALIDIITNNQTRQNRNTVTYEDNWVYVPGNTITGDASKPYPITTLQEFQSLFGAYDPDVDFSFTYKYVSGILEAGLPVLFRRIVKTSPDDATQTSLLVTKATHTISVEIESQSKPQVTFTDKFGGSFGNDLFISLRSTPSYYYLDVCYGKVTVENGVIKNIATTTLESLKLAPYSASDTDAQIKLKLHDALQTIGSESTRIDVTVPEEAVAATFDILDYLNKFQKDQSADYLIHLNGGTDVSDQTGLYTGVANSFKGITDKLLYRPKYLTTGGMCAVESDDQVKSQMIVEMMNLSQTRQDCMALVDLPSNLGDGQTYQNKLAKYGYVQSSATQVLPAALCVGPWYYTLVNNKYDWMPGSFAYLRVVGSDLSIGGNTYTPKAGMQNGRLYNATATEFPIGSSLLEAWQEDNVVNINPIIRIQGGNYEIAGNNTMLVKNEDEENLYSEASATMAVIEIKRQVFNTALQYQYMYNSVEAFENFSVDVAKQLDSMKTEGAVYDYNIINNSTNDEPRKLKILLQVWLTPTIKAIEIYLNIAYGDVQVNSAEGGND